MKTKKEEIASNILGDKTCKNCSHCFVDRNQNKKCSIIRKDIPKEETCKEWHKVSMDSINELLTKVRIKYGKQD